MMKCIGFALLLLVCAGCGQHNSLTAGRPVGTAGSWFTVAVAPGAGSGAFAVFADAGHNEVSYHDLLAWLSPGACGLLHDTDITIPSRAESDSITFRDSSGATWPTTPTPYNTFGEVYETTDTIGAQTGTWQISVGA